MLNVLTNTWIFGFIEVLKKGDNWNNHYGGALKKYNKNKFIDRYV